MSESDMVKHFMEDCPQPMTVFSCLNDVVSEAGEVAKELNIAYGWGRKDEPVYRDNFERELGQLLFATHQLIVAAGYDSSKLLSETITDFRKRYEKQGHTGSSDYL